MQCCNTIWNSKIRNNHKVHPCGGVHMSSPGDRMGEKKGETSPLRKAKLQEIYIFFTKEHNLKLTQDSFKLHANSLQ